MNTSQPRQRVRYGTPTSPSRFPYSATRLLSRANGGKWYRVRSAAGIEWDVVLVWGVSVRNYAQRNSTAYALITTDGTRLATTEDLAAGFGRFEVVAEYAADVVLTRLPE